MNQPALQPAAAARARKAAVCLAMASDRDAFEPHATVIASVLRHTRRPVHVRMWLRGMSATSFETGRLRVEFLTVREGLSGGVPGHVSQSTHDRLLVLRDCPDWSRVLILDYDQLVLCDTAPLFDMSMRGKLLAARLCHIALGDAAREWFGRRLPDKWRHCEGFPFFYMGPFIDLDAARTARLWEDVAAFQVDARMEEQIALTVACRGRIKPLPPKWNLVPHWDPGAGEGTVLHFTGPRKPWNDPSIRCAGLWLEQASTWKELRSGVLSHSGRDPRRHSRTR